MSATPLAPARTGPIRLGPGARTALRPAADPVLRAGFWAERQEVNARVGIPQGPLLLESAGNLHDLRLAAGGAGEFRGDYPFMDSDVYKWLEAASWRLAALRPDGGAGAGAGDGAEDGPGDGAGGGADDGRETRRLAEDVERVAGLVARAQRPDGYINTWFQAGMGRGPFTDLRWGHELYCAGHLIQAAVAHHRATGRDTLLEVARRFADHLDAVFGPAGSGRPIDGVDGHPEVETALVELYRETGEERFRTLAGYFVDARGRGLLGGEVYCQDRVPVREARTVEGHAVRQLYLLAAVADLAAETGDEELCETGRRLWSAMAATKTHLTGGLGAHHDKEDFGDPYELPTERAYCETCAAVASIQFGWRMALLTGQARYSDLIERTLYNGFLSGVSLDGESWLYINPLQVRDGHTDQGGDKSARRTRWFRCACCPPNAMRLLASLEHYFASTDGRGLQLHQYGTGTFRGEAFGAPLIVSANTDYPWEGRITLTIEQTPSDVPWTLSLRIPQWCDRFTVQHGEGGGGDEAGTPLEDGWLRLTRTWRAGDRVVLELGLEPRLTVADPRVDAVRGCVAIERGPLVYCLEGVDHPGGGLDDMVVDTARPLVAKHRPDLLGGVTTILAGGYRRGAAPQEPQEPPEPQSWWPYSPDSPDLSGTADAQRLPAPDTRIELTAIPYFAWANRQDGAMRVWLPTE